MFNTLETTARISSLNLLFRSKKRSDPDSELLGMVECISPQKASARIPSSLSDIVRNRPYLSELDPSQLDLEGREHSLEEKVSQDRHWDE